MEVTAPSIRIAYRLLVALRVEVVFDSDGQIHLRIYILSRSSSRHMECKQCSTLVGLSCYIAELHREPVPYHERLVPHRCAL